jgi:hypothetical protein
LASDCLEKQVAIPEKVEASQTCSPSFVMQSDGESENWSESKKRKVKQMEYKLMDAFEKLKKAKESMDSDVGEKNS